MTSLPQAITSTSRTAQALRCLLLVSLTVLASSTLNAQSIKAGDLAPFEVVYEVGNNMITAGSARLALSQSNGVWNYSLKTKPRGVFKLAGKGKISEWSQFTTKEADGFINLFAQKYQYRQDNERRREVDGSFDWTGHNITHVYRGNEVTEPFTGHVWDRLTVTLVIMNALRNDFDRAVFAVYDTDEIKEVEFVNEGTETLKTPLGRIDTIKVTNRNAVGGSRETTTWFAPSLDYVPIKIEHKKRKELVARLSLIKLVNRVTSLELENEADKSTVSEEVAKP